jgi:tyrosyl-DNA phosphodiesterase 2
MELGYTYDGRSNPMLGPYNSLQARLDRVLARVRDWQVKTIEMVGKDAIPGVTYTRNYKRGPKELPVLPSDHFGLYVTLDPC